ncbi:hypothetical protein SLEP1_g39008 [Rubroshorea leprosula]|uniref:Uncharacterized protein n=1 Tax=Rubroshorea leprosula TaxID=152421 RepID=A0AAV5KYU7_9ROSI|nr:hypothetical protein SLEP1_g39008 [Rubroshorea leprosula]
MAAREEGWRVSQLVKRERENAAIPLYRKSSQQETLLALSTDIAPRRCVYVTVKERDLGTVRGPAPPKLTKPISS